MQKHLSETNESNWAGDAWKNNSFSKFLEIVKINERRLPQANMNRYIENRTRKEYMHKEQCWKKVKIGKDSEK